jgi:hypothetical protein
MAKTKDKKVNKKTSTSAIPLYEIRLKGHLDARWFHRFEGLQITLLDSGETILAGPVADQSALFGILSQIRNIGIPLIDVHSNPQV